MAFRLARVSTVIVVLAGAAGSQACFGQSQPSSSSPSQSDPALKGPEVTDHSAPKANGQAGFGPDAIEKKKNGKRPTPPLPLATFLKTLDVLRAAPTPEATRLTSDQDAKIKAAASAFDTSTKQYLATNQSEIDSLRAQLSPSDREMLDQQIERGGPIKLSKAGFGSKGAALKHKQGTTDSSPSPSTSTTTSTDGTSTTTSKDTVAAARARLVEIYSGRPKAQETEDKILGVLTPDQLTIENDQLAKLESAKTKRANAAHAKKTNS